MRVFSHKTNSLRRLRNGVFATMFLFAVTVLNLAPLQIALAADEGLTPVTDKTGEVGQPVAISDLQITGTDNDPLMINVFALDGSFSFSNTSATITGSGNNITLTGTRSQINASLASMRYTGATIGVATVHLSLGSNVPNIIFNPENGHGYSIINESLTWDQAKDAAQMLYYGGVQGYLATITSQEENDFIKENLQDDGWIGASDSVNEGDWYWVTGPEAGTHFWTGVGVDGAPELGPGDVPYYHAWADHAGPGTGEPNNSGNEDCAQFYAGAGEAGGSNGKWNDLACDGDPLESYVVEFGGGDLPSPLNSSFTVNVTARTVTIDNCDELQGLTLDNDRDTIVLAADIDCEGVDFISLMAYDDDTENIGFKGVFDGAGHTISNLSINGSYGPAGLFSVVNGAEFKNLVIANSSIYSESDAPAGSLIGYAENVTVTDVAVRNSNVSSEGSGAGGLIGMIEAYDAAETSLTHISRVSIEGGSVYAYGDSAGGLVGRANIGDAAENTLLIEIVSTNTFVEAGEDNAAGIVGYLDMYSFEENGVTTATIRDSYSWSEIYAPDGDNIGGIVGHMAAESGDSTVTITLQRVYSNGKITGYNEVGGLVGELCEPYEGTEYIIRDSFSASEVIALDGYDPLLGALFGNGLDGLEVGPRLTVANVYYDQTRAGIDAASPIPGVDDIAQAVNTDGLQRDYFINNTTNTPMDTWDFDDIWVANRAIMPTFKPVVDFDQDGVSDDIEANAPNDGDGNNDGIADAQQNNVSSLVDGVSGQHVTLAVQDSCVLSGVSITKEGDHLAKDGSISYKTGFVNFTATGCDGDQADVQLFFHGIMGAGFETRKYNPVTGEYFTIAGATLGALAAPLSGTSVAYTVTDGGNLDVNDEEGVITDPAALGFTSSARTPDTGYGNANMLPFYIAGGLGLGLIVLIAVRKKAFAKTK